MGFDRRVCKGLRLEVEDSGASWVLHLGTADAPRLEVGLDRHDAMALLKALEWAKAECEKRNYAAWD
jgi:hypothetical protein